MKKTIAILLVLVIGMAGVFAADDASLKLTTTVNTLNEFKITSVGIETGSENDYSAFTGLVPLAETTVAADGTLGSTAFLAVANNSTTPFKVGLRASKLTASGINTTIGYTVSCGTASSVPAVESANIESANFIAALEVTGTVEHGVEIATEQISVSIDQNDFNSAAASTDYIGYIHFNIATI
nr:hypothetical protein [uncultured Sphaerochaeta sp.]